MMHAHLITQAVRMAARTRGVAPATSTDMPPGLDRMLPRDIRLKSSGWVLLVLAILIAAGSVPAGIALELTSRRDRDAARTIREQSVETMGTITRKWRVGTGDDARRWVAYEFTADGRTYRQERRAPSRGTWERADVGSPLPVRFMPNDPNQNWPWGREPNVLPPFVPILVGVVMLTVGGLMTLALQHERRLLAEGRAARATVTKHTASSHGKMAAFEFTALSGTRVKGSTGPSHKPAPIGTSLWVLYLPDQPTKSRPYPLSLVQLAHPTALKARRV